jgi:hypothetical protein
MGYEVIQYYIVFALATAITAVITILNPVLRQLEQEGSDSYMLEKKYTTYSAFIILSIVAAPILILPTIFTKANSTFKQSLLNSFREAE